MNEEEINEVFLDSNFKKKLKEVAFDPNNKAHKRELNKILAKTFYLDFEDCMYQQIYDMLKVSHPHLEFKLMICKK